MIKNIIFDWSGVISDNTYNVYLSAMGVLKRFNINSISFDQFREKFEVPFMNFYNYFVPNLNFNEEKAIYNEEYGKLEKAKSYSSIVDLIKKFKGRSIKMVVISSEPAEYLNEALEDFGLKDTFIDIKTDLHNKKEALAEVLDNNNFKPEETLFIGDTTHEIEVGKELGIKTAGVTWGIQLEDKLKSANPDFIFHNIEEMESVLLEK